jgi:hypothetical protein
LPRPRYSCAALLAAAVLGPVAPAQGAEPPIGAASQPAAALDPATLLLFSVTLDGLTLSEGLGAYGSPTDPLIPMGELARLLEADVDVLPAERRIVGRLGQARTAILVDLNAGVARAGGRELALSAQDAAVAPTEIYLRTSLVRKLLGLAIEVADDELVLRLRATEKFPVQARLERQSRRPDPGQPGQSQEATLRVAEPYAFFSPPGIDVVLDGGLESGANNRTFRYDLRFAGDLFWSNLQGYVGSDEEGRATNARVMLQRRSLEGDMLGPLRAREVSVGDVYSPGLSMGVRSVAGAGFTFSTAPLEQTSVFNRIDLRGDLPPGYDVELYVNDVLRSSTNQSINGRYEFLDIPLSPGLNVVRVVTYGPRGERLEEVQVVNVGAALLRQGEAHLAFGIIDQDTPLFRPRQSSKPLIGDPTLFADHGARAVVSVNYGLTDLISVTAGAARIPQPRGGALGVYSLGARTSLFGLATQFDAAWNGDGGAGVSVGAAGQFGPLSAVLRHAEYRDGFVDEANLAFDARYRVDRRSELTLDSSVNLRGRIVPVSMRLLRNDYEHGAYDMIGAARASSGIGTVLLSAGLEYERRHLRPAAVDETLKGYVTASTFRGYKWQVRTSLDYDILPDFKARFLSLIIDRRLSDTWSVRFGLGQPLRDTHDWNVTASSIVATRYGDFALTAEYDNTDEDWRVAAQWSFGLGYDPERGRYNILRTGPGSGGSVLFNAFLDENGDGIRQAGEAPAPNVALDGAARGAVTGADGRILVTGLGAGPTAYMDVNLEKLDNPAVSTPPTKLQLRPRPGRTARVDYPMRPTGGVMVKVELVRDDGQRVGLASVRVQLVRPGAPPVDGVTEFDGSAMFDAVPLGAWRVQLEPLQAGKLRMRMLDAASVKIEGNGDFAPDVLVQVRFDPPLADTTVASTEGAPR